MDLHKSMRCYAKILSTWAQKGYKAQESEMLQKLNTRSNVFSFKSASLKVPISYQNAILNSQLDHQLLLAAPWLCLLLTVNSEDLAP